MSKNSTYRLQYYEDDVVVYTDRGKHPKLPNKYQTCTFWWNHHKHILKAFYTKRHAEVVMSYAKRHSYPSSEKYVIFYCPRCCMYHITTEKNYQKYINK